MRYGGMGAHRTGSFLVVRLRKCVTLHWDWPVQWPLASNIAADDMTTQHNPGTSNPAFQAGDWV